MTRLASIPALAILFATAAALAQTASTTPARPDFSARPATQPATAPAKARLRPGVTADQAAAAVKTFDKAMEHAKADRLLDARGDLTAVLLGGHLDSGRESQAAAKLAEIAEKTLLSKDVYEGDPYTSVYKIAKGDSLTKVVAKQKLGVTHSFIQAINRIDPNRLRVGQQIKLVGGTVHAAVSKSDFTMDLYLQMDGQPKAFLKRITVGLGKEDGTPAGSWEVLAKASRAKWTPPPSAVATAAIEWGKPGYPLGRDGYWIALVGTDDNTRRCTSYGVHGTNEPESIGKAASLGCIRLADEDIEFVYWVMSEKLSTIVVK